MSFDWEDDWPVASDNISPISNVNKPNPQCKTKRFNNYKNRRTEESRAPGDCKKMWIPTKFVGKVIGRGGSNISDLEYQSGAKIQVTKETDKEKTLLKLFGTAESFRKATQLINEITQDRQKTYTRNESISHQINSKSVVTSNESVPIKKPERAKFFDMEECEKEYWSNFPEIRKKFYEEHPAVRALTDKDVKEIRLENNNIVVDRVLSTENGAAIPKPVLTFEQAFCRYPEILSQLKKAQFDKPTPIQCQAWPILMSGEDMIGIAQTGSGKTLAFLLPAFIHIEGQLTPKEDRKGPAVLVVAPTRELALQIDKEIKKFNYHTINSCCIYGGGNRKQQVAELKSGVDIVIATPGRMNDLFDSGDLYIENITYLILDEADRMLDMGFEAQLRRVLYGIRPNRQTVMTSATWPSGVRRLAVSYTKDPIQVYVGSLDLTAAHSVAQIIHILEESDKEKTFFDFIANMGPDDKVIVFCSTKGKTDYLSVECIMKRLPSASIHSNKEQCDREQAIADIMDGTAKILIATDVASRGLDIDDVTHVINYDFPKNIEEYVHRVGRTGRAGKTGESISYFTRENWASAGELINILEEAKQYVPKELYDMSERFASRQQKKTQNPTRGFRSGSRW
ncbi:putative ATP-dependent RNA helicase DDX43 [Rhynchophorus ferrugineus]|uniref:putative ATP-dependent RNA helicase DDX43 n=1 Tax=Rhynchophorus ferrugineus TaxID=354439 RepID=UPI003FCE1850